MWFLLDQCTTARDGIEQMLPVLQAIAQFNEELRCRLADDGMDGIEGAFTLSRRIGAMLGDVSASRLEAMLAELAGLERGLSEMLGSLEDLKSLKRALA